MQKADQESHKECGDSHSGMVFGAWNFTHAQDESTRGTSEIMINSAPISFNWKARLEISFSNFPEGATTRTGEPRLTVAMGPCRKSAVEYDSAITPVNSLIFNAISKAVE